MFDKDKPPFDSVAVEFELWNTLCEIYREKGIDLPTSCRNWAEDVERQLEKPSPNTEFRELCNDGCLPEVLALLLLKFQYAPDLAKIWTRAIGAPKVRAKVIRSLEKAATQLESHYGNIISGDEGVELDRSLVAIKRIPIPILISELRLHAKALWFTETVKKKAKLKTLDELARYLLTAYVARMTGSFHDRCVAALVGEIQGDLEYTEVAQRVWRGRHYDKLELHFAWIPQLVVAFSVAMAKKK